MPSKYKQPYNILREKITDKELEEMEEDGRKPNKEATRLKNKLREKIHRSLKYKKKSSVSRFYEWLSKLVKQ